MKKIVISCLIVIGALFQGCAIVEMEAKEYAKTSNVAPYVTYFCTSYPFQTTGECDGLMETKILCGSTKLCFGFSELNKSPDGMDCVYHDFIKGK